jgi:hydroxypyruvate isomerase
MPTRRHALKTLIAGAGALSISPTLSFSLNAQHQLIDSQPMTRKGNIRHSVCRWTYSQLTLDELCTYAKSIGITAIDLIGPGEWAILKKHGLDSSMCNGAEINLTDGFCEPKFHEKLLANYSDMIIRVAEAGYKNLICFSGNRRGMDDLEGMRNCATALRQLMPLAEKHGVVLVMELFNTKKGGHLDYMCDSTLWGVALCDMVGSEHFKLLYDIYHMQLNEGNIIQNIRDYHAYFAHYHTAGVPGRNEIDENQELYYPAIMRAIVQTGFKGYVAQEFIPLATDKLASLKKAIDLCDV